MKIQYFFGVFLSTFAFLCYVLFKAFEWQTNFEFYLAVCLVSIGVSAFFYPIFSFSIQVNGKEFAGILISKKFLFSFLPWQIWSLSVMWLISIAFLELFRSDYFEDFPDKWVDFYFLIIAMVGSSLATLVVFLCLGIGIKFFVQKIKKSP